MMRAVPAALLLTAVCFACAEAGAGQIDRDTTWSGNVRVEGMTVVEQGATLTIEPGTVVAFERSPGNDEGLAGSGILVRGNIIAGGKPENRISFTSAAGDPGPGDWGEIMILGSAGSRFSHCDFSFGGWGIHVHDSALVVEGCSFTDNSFGGLRGKGDGVKISGSSFTGMDIGIRFWQGSPSIRGCTITGNVTGVFFRQECGGAVVQGNNIFGNREYDLKLGDMHEDDLDASSNWWGTDDVAEIRKKIFDKGREGYIGRVIIEPVLAGMVHED